MASIYDYEWTERACIERLEDFMADYKTLAPRLENITLKLQDGMSHLWDGSERQEFRDLCEHTGLKCEVLDLRRTR